MTISATPREKSVMSANSNSKKRRIHGILPSKELLKHFYAKYIDSFFNEYLPLYKHPAERVIWLFVHIVATASMILMICNATYDYDARPTAISPDPQTRPIQDVDFPAVAICNLNRISRKALEDLAEELLEIQATTLHRNLTSERLASMLRHLGSFYHFEESHAEVTDVLHAILQRGCNDYNVARIMKRLSPKCGHTLKKCSWDGKDRVCNDIFFLTKTQEGFCCTFNYGKHHNIFRSEQDELFLSEKTKRAKNAGAKYGLSVFLNPEIEDYAYAVDPVLGFKVLIFPFNSYAETSSGGIHEILISPRTETFLKVRAASLYSVPAVMQYRVAQRDCLFDSEQSAIFQGHYSYNECIMNCRMGDILRLCKCIPFYYPLVNASVRTCNFEDLRCLNKYQKKWRNINPRPKYRQTQYINMGFTAEFLKCDCYPSCDDTVYSMIANTVPLTAPTVTWNSENTLVLKNHSIIHIHFDNVDVAILRQDVLYYWYELMSNYGGICNFFLGISFVNVLEIFYAIIRRLLKHPGGSTADVRKATTVPKLRVSVVQSAALNPPSLYWHEISGPKKIHCR